MMISDEEDMPMEVYKLNKVRENKKKKKVLNSVEFTSVGKQWTLVSGLLHGRRIDAVALVLVRSDGQILADADALRVFRTFTRVLHEALDLSGDWFVDCPAAHRIARANFCLVLRR